MERKGKLFWTGLAGIGAGFLVLAIIVTGFMWRRMNPQEQAAQLYATGEVSLKDGRDVEAWELFSRAIQLDPAEPRYVRSASFAAERIGDLDAAQRLARQAWQAGLRDSDLLRILVNAARVISPTPIRPEQLLLMLEQLPDGEPAPVVSELHAEVLQLTGQTQAALAIWKELLADQPTPERIDKIAEALIRVGQPHAAREFLESPEHQGLLRELSFSRLANLQAAEQDWQAAQATCEQAKRVGEYGSTVALDHALLLILAQQDEDAVRVLESLAEQTSTPPSIYAVHARIVLSYLQLRTGDSAVVEQLLRRAQEAGNEIWNEAEQQFHEAVLTLLTNEDPPEDDADAEENSRFRVAMRKVDLALRGLPRQPVIEWVAGCLNAHEAKFFLARQRFAAIEGILAAAPVVLVNHAQVLHQTREDEQAFWLLDTIHRSGTASRGSLELLTELSLRTEKESLQDWARDRLADQFGDQTAGEPFDLLAPFPPFRATDEAYPDPESLQVARIRHLIASHRDERAYREMEAHAAAAEQLLPERALLLERLGREDDALLAYQQAIETPQEASVHAAYGDILLDRQQEEQAEQQFQTALASDPQHPTALLGLAALAERSGDFLRSRQLALSALEGDNRLVEAHLLLAAADFQLSRFAEGLRACNQALQLDPTSIRATALKSLFHLELGELQQAEQLLKPFADQEFPDPELFVPIILLKQVQDQWQESLQWIQRGLEVRPNDVDLMIQHVETLLVLERMSDAETALNAYRNQLPEADYVSLKADLEAISLNPARAEQTLRAHLDLPGIGVQLWGLLLEQERPAEAEALLTARDWSIDDLSQCGQSAAVVGDFSLAARCFQQALTLDPDNPTLLNEWAWNAMQGGATSIDEIIDASQRAHKMNPGEVEFLHTYAEALARDKRYEVSHELLSQSRFTSTDARLSLLWARSLAALGNTLDAIDALQRARELLVNNPDTEEREMRDQIEREIEQLQVRPH